MSYAAGHVLVRWRLLSWVKGDSNKLPGESVSTGLGGREAGLGEGLRVLSCPSRTVQDQGPGCGSAFLSELGSCSGLGKPGTLNSALFPGSDAMKGQLTLLNPPSLQVQASWASVSPSGQREAGLN